MKLHSVLTGTLSIVMALGTFAPAVYAAPDSVSKESVEEMLAEVDGIKISLNNGGTVVLKTEKDDGVYQTKIRTDGEETSIEKSIINDDKTIEKIIEDASETINGCTYLFEKEEQETILIADPDEDYEVKSVTIDEIAEKKPGEEIKLDFDQDETVAVVFSEKKEETEEKEQKAEEEKKEILEKKEEAAKPETRREEKQAVEKTSQEETPAAVSEYGGVKVAFKDRSGSVPQGDATLAGAEFSIINKNSVPITVRGNKCDPDDVVLTIKSDQRGIAASRESDLPCGNYEIRQTKAADGYTIDKDWVVEALVAEADQLIDLTDTPAQADVITGRIKIVKKDAELNKKETIAGGIHAGSVFQITNKSQASVLVDNKEYAPGDVITTIRMDLDGSVKTPKDMLPYGTYEVKELSSIRNAAYANVSYLLTDTKEKTVEVRGEKAKKVVFTDQVIRSDITFARKDGKKDMSLIPFVITQLSTGEKHVILTDKKGYYSSSRYAHSLDTNMLDYLLDDYDEEKGIDSDKLQVYQFGTWFGQGREGTMADVNDSLPALPYGQYLVSELRCDANQGKTLAANVLVNVRQNSRELAIDLAGDK